MSLVRRRRPVAAAVSALFLTLVISSVLTGAAFGAQSTITQNDCQQGRIRDTAGNTIPIARCEKLIGKTITLASTGFEDWIVAVAGVACLAGAFALRASVRRSGSIRPAR